MSDSQHSQPQDAAPLAQPASLASGRRRLLKGGLAASPILLSVASRPTLAASCTHPSAFTSLNVSGNNKVFACTGGSPEYWLLHLASWPSAYKAGKGGSGTPFNATFGGAVFQQNASFQDVLEGTARMGQQGLARHIVASALNVAAGLTTQVLSLATVKSMWTAALSPGYYEPFAGVKWYCDSSQPTNAGGGMSAYLQSTYSQSA